MPDKGRQADAYLEQATTTLRAAEVLFEDDPDEFDAQIVKNAYDALEQALSAGIAADDLDVPRRHPGKIQKFFEIHDNDELEEIAFHWLSRRDSAQYVDFEGGELAKPSDAFDVTDAEQIIEDATRIIAFVRTIFG